MTVWIGGLIFFAAWGAILGWKYAPAHVSHVTLVTRSKLAHFVSFVFAFLCVFLSHMAHSLADGYHCRLFRLGISSFLSYIPLLNCRGI